MLQLKSGLKQSRATILDNIGGDIGNTPLIKLREFSINGIQVVCKYEGRNPTGSIKARTGTFFVGTGISDGSISRQSVVVVDSSGNQATGTALGGLLYGVSVIAVIDPKIQPWKRQMLQNLGADIVEICEADEYGSYLGARKRYIKQFAQRHPQACIFDQYSDPKGWHAHYYGTGEEIVRDLDGDPLHYLVCSVGTGGTILGLYRRLQEVYPNLQVIAVDEEGSCLFGGAPGERQIVGIGSSQDNPTIVAQFERECPHREVVRVTAAEAFQACRDLWASTGISAGGSSGAVVAALKKKLPSIPPHSRVLAIFPDTGDHYPNIFSA